MGSYVGEYIGVNEDVTGGTIGSPANISREAAFVYSEGAVSLGPNLDVTGSVETVIGDLHIDIITRVIKNEDTDVTLEVEFTFTAVNGPTSFGGGAYMTWTSLGVTLTVDSVSSFCGFDSGQIQYGAPLTTLAEGEKRTLKASLKAFAA